jgi:hypothetical protein
LRGCPRFVPMFHVAKDANLGPMEPRQNTAELPTARPNSFDVALA